MALKPQQGTEPLGAPGIALAQQSYSGHCWDLPGSWDHPGSWPLLGNVTVSPCSRSAVSQKVFPVLCCPFPPCQQPDTNWASWECCPCPLFQAQPSSGWHWRPTLLLFLMGMFPVCSPWWHCSSASSGSCPCHRWALLSLGWRRSLLGPLQEAKATGAHPAPALRRSQAQQGSGGTSQ